MRDQRTTAPSKLSNEQLLSATRALVARSNEATALLVAHLAEIDNRKLYLDQAQPSMFSWCVAELGCSEDVACNWIAVARASRRYPLVLNVLREGKVHLTGLRILAPHLTEEGHLSVLEEAAGKSKREIEELVARIAPRPAVAASIRKLPGTKASGGGEKDGSSIPLGSETASGSVGIGAEASAPSSPAETSGDARVSAAVSNPEENPRGSGAQAQAFGTAPRPAHRPQTPGRVEPLAEDAFKVTFTASRRLREKIRQAQDLLGHQVPSGDLAEILERGLDLLMDEVRKKRFAAGRKRRSRKAKGEVEEGSTAAANMPSAVETTPAAVEESVEVEEQPKAPEESVAESDKPRSRYIPAEVRRAVHERDGERCTFVDERGRRCPSRRRLELDHAEGFARGAPHTVDSLRLRCKPHNQGSAERMYGRAFMEKKRAAKSSAPARIPRILEEVGSIRAT